MCKALRVALTYACLLCCGIVHAADSNKIQGVWRITERIDAKGVASKGAQPSLYMFTMNHYSMLVVLGEAARPDGPEDLTKATAQELRDAWGPFVANAGTYEVNDKELTLRTTIAKSPRAMKGDTMRVYSYKFEGEGKILVLHGVRTNRGPLTDEGVIKLERRE